MAFAVTYQGWVCAGVTFRRERGFTGTLSTLLMPVRSWPLEIKPGSQGPSSALALVAESGDADDFANALGLTGDLDIVEVDPDSGRVHQVKVSGLRVLKIEATQRNLLDAAGPHLVQVTVVDDRFFWTRGVMDRWSFNRMRPDGTISADSTKTVDSDAVTLYDIVNDYVVRCLPGSPKLFHAPQKWKDARGPWEWSPFQSAVSVLADIVDQRRVADPVLLLDGRVAVYEHGERSPVAVEPPADHVLWKDGGGDVKSTELLHPEQVVAVVGGPRVCSVALDDWEPVLVFDRQTDYGLKTDLGPVEPLTESVIRRLTGGEFGLDWLAKFVLEPDAYRGHPKLPRVIGELLQQQAWKVYRMPGLSASADGAKAYRNAHLLPMLPRAETDASGRRRGVSVDTYGFAEMHREQAVSEDHDNLRAATRARKKLRELYRVTRLNERGGGGEVRPNPIKLKGHRAVINDPGLLLTELQRFALGYEGNGNPLLGVYKDYLDEVRFALDYATDIAASEGAPGGLSSEYLAAVRKMAQAEEALGSYGTEAVLELAETTHQIEVRLRDQKGAWDYVASAFNDVFYTDRIPTFDITGDVLGNASVLNEFRDAVDRALAKVRKAREEWETAEKEGGPKSRTVTFYVNLLRRPDPTADVIDVDQGLIQLHHLPGHLDNPDVSSLSLARFVPGPVRVTFGARLRPSTVKPALPRALRKDEEALVTGAEVIELSGGGRIFVPSSDPSLTPNAATPRLVGGLNVVPSILGDEDSVFLGLFRAARDASGALVAGEVPAAERGATYPDALRIDRPDMVELVRIDGSSNRAGLLSAAEEIARGHLTLPDRVDGGRTVYGRPWPVECDGKVQSVTIQTRMRDGVPCGFETVVETGAQGVPAPGGVTRERPRPVPSPAPDNRDREGLP